MFMNGRIMEKDSFGCPNIDRILHSFINPTAEVNKKKCF